VKRTLHKDVVCAIKTNRTMALSLEDKLQGHYVTVTDVDIEPGTTRLVYLNGVEFPVLLAKQVFINQDGSSGVLYLVSTDTALSDTAITTLYHRRWTVETFHKSLKQNASLEKSPTKVERTQRNHIFAAMLAFVKLETLKLQTTVNHFALKHRLYIKALKVCFAELQTFKEQEKTNIKLCFA
jgi:IS4 transposase